MYKILVSFFFITTMLVAGIGSNQSFKIRGGVSVDSVGIISDTDELTATKKLKVKIPSGSTIEAAFLYVSYMDMEEVEWIGYPTTAIEGEKPYVAIKYHEPGDPRDFLNIQYLDNTITQEYSQGIDTNNDGNDNLELGVYKIDYTWLLKKEYKENPSGEFSLDYYEWGDRKTESSKDDTDQTLPIEEKIKRGTKIDGATLVVIYKDDSAPFREVRIIVGGSGTYEDNKPYLIEDSLVCNFDKESTDPSILSATITHEIDASWDLHGELKVNGVDVSNKNVGGADDGNGHWESGQIWQRSALITSGSFGAGANGVPIGIDGDSINSDDTDELYNITANLDNDGELKISHYSGPDNDGYLTLSIIQAPVRVDAVCSDGRKDTDGDGVADNDDLDDDNDGIPDTEEMKGDPNRDTDGDGIIDMLDLDSDNDGISDIIEAGGTDSDNDGKIDNFTDDNHNGLADSVDPDKGGTALPIPDTDNDGIKDFQDLDADNDGIPDVIEAGGTDPDNDGKIGTGVITDENNNGLDDTLEGTGHGLPIPDTDNDGIKDFQDLDSDNDGIPDVVEADESKNDRDLDPDNDGKYGTGEITDTNKNGLDDALEGAGHGLPIPDTDGDGKKDFQDLDSDGDGVFDLIEAQDLTDPRNLDSDNDGMIDGPIKDNNHNGLSDDVEGSKALPIPDTDGDKIKNFQDDDDDGDTVLTKDEDVNNDKNYMNDDTDRDDIPNYLDPDDDGDTILTKNEDPDNDNNVKNDDTDGDKTPNYLDPDDDGDGIETKDETPDQNGDGDDEDAADIDNDGNKDYLQKGINECSAGTANCGTNEKCVDKAEGYECICKEGYIKDNNGVCVEDNSCTPACEGNSHCNNGTCECDEGYEKNGTTCVDIDECADSSKNDCSENANCTNKEPSYECECKEGFTGDGKTCTPNSNPDTDTDGDGIKDNDDLDDDNDGIPDTVENAGPNNGDTDKDGIPDRLELDSDNDGIKDIIEAGGTDDDNDGKVDNFLDDNKNGLDKTVDPTEGGTALETPDHDNDGHKDFQDADDDNDTVLTKDEDINKDGNYMNDDTDKDGVPNYLDPDDDGDTVLTKDEDVNDDGNPMNDDTDNDSIPNYLDADDDGDNVLTKDEDSNKNGNLEDDDDDKDGTPNYLDPDLGNGNDNGGYYSGNSVLGCSYNSNNSNNILFFIIILFVIFTKRKLFSRRK